MPTVTQAIRNFLTARRASHNGPDLLDRWNVNMETQVNVAAGNGEPVEGKRNIYTDGVNKWFNIRIPKNAATTPEFKDYPLHWPLDEHAEAIGWTGWDWKERKSRALGFDFDAITGHAKGIGISDEELARVKEVAQALPYVEVRKSTGGNGLHLYVYFDDAGVPTANHTEHAALGRAVLAKMSLETGFDFAAQVDACGGNMWIWHVKMTRENEGLKLIKPATKVLTVADLPANWKDHIEVVTRKRTKIRAKWVAPTDEDAFEALTASRPPVNLDDEHKRLMDWLGENGHVCVWDQDRRMLTTHTAALKAAHEALKLKGAFETLATGKEQGDHNCFCFPLANGAWAVYRYSVGMKEAPTWRSSERDWTYCHFNQYMDLKLAAAAHGGVKAPDGSYVFESGSEALQAIKALGASAELPSWIIHREVTLKSAKGELIAQVPLEDSDKAPDMRKLGWVKHKANWAKVIEIEVASAEPETVIPHDLDDRIRHVVTPTMEDAGWAVRDTKGRWIDEPKGNVKSVLKSWDLSDAEAEAVMGQLITNVWDLVNLPFQDEFLSGRRWNRDAAKLAFVPTDRDRELSHPHWDIIFEHCGSGLDEAVETNAWCRRHGIKTGGDYLRRWAAILFQRPTHPLPYLFFFSETDDGQELQNTGKSSLHQALGLLMQEGKGYTEADSALTNPNGFNRTLAGAILCFIEETDLSKAGATAYNRVKNWVTGDNILIHPKGLDAYMMPNTTHWVQCANRRRYAPAFPGDTRIVMTYVPPFTGEEIPWKEKMKPALEKEAPDFLRMILDLPLPAPAGRLWLPVLETSAKREAMAASDESKQNGERPAIDLDQLVDWVRRYIAEEIYWELQGQKISTGRRLYWEGTFSGLAKALGWKDEPHPNQLSRAIRDVRDRLREGGIEVVLPEEQAQRNGKQRKLTIAYSCMIEPEWSDEQIVAELEHSDDLLACVPPGI